MPRFKLRTLLIVLAFVAVWTPVFVWLMLAFNNGIYWPIIPLTLLAAMLSAKWLPTFSSH